MKLFMHFGHPYIHLFKIRRIFDLLVSHPFLVLGSDPSIYVTVYGKRDHVPQKIRFQLTLAFSNMML